MNRLHGGGSTIILVRAAPRHLPTPHAVRLKSVCARRSRTRQMLNRGGPFGVPIQCLTTREKQTCPGWMVSRSEAIHLIDPFLTADEIGDASVRTPDRDSELRIADRNLTWCQLDANDHMTSFGGLLSDIYSGGAGEVEISHFFWWFWCCLMRLDFAQFPRVILVFILKG